MEETGEKPLQVMRIGRTERRSIARNHTRCPLCTMFLSYEEMIRVDDPDTGRKYYCHPMCVQLYEEQGADDASS